MATIAVAREHSTVGCSEVCRCPFECRGSHLSVSLKTEEKIGSGQRERQVVGEEEKHGHLQSKRLQHVLANKRESLIKARRASENNNNTSVEAGRHISTRESRIARR